MVLKQDTEISEQKEMQKNSMIDIVSIAVALADYITDLGVAPEQAGTYEADSKLSESLSPFYIKTLPVHDGWDNLYRVYCGKVCNGIYEGISNCDSGDFVIVSYGRDGKKEDWAYNSNEPGAGLYTIEGLEDFDKDLICWNGSWVRAPYIKR
jgi:hypothetical protein